MHQTLVNVITTNLQIFNIAYSGDVPLFRVHTFLAAPDVVISPTGNEVG